MAVPVIVTLYQDKIDFIDKVPIVPISHNAGLCWPSQSFIKSPGLIQIHIGSPIDSAGRKDDELMTQLREWIVAHSL